MKKLLYCTLVLYSYLSLSAQTIEMQMVASGFSEPVDITHAGDDRLFIVEKDGLIQIIDASGIVLPAPFLNISNLVSTGGERGLLGLAFHPNYEENGYFFVNYTNSAWDTRIVRYSRSADDPNIADPNSALQILAVDQPAGNHNGGGIKFGPDGYLYIGLGDGGSGGDPWNNSQTPTTLLGKMLRIDVDVEGLPYGIPPDNPFVENDEVLDEIWALGLRNPWRYSFDRLTGDLWIGDVGQDAYEEIDFQPAASAGGENYGWRCYEGDEQYDDSPSCNGDYTFPVYTLRNGFNSPYCSVTGGVVYRGSEYPELYGKYLYGDFCDDDLLSLEPDGNGGWTAEVLGEFPYTYSTFGEDSSGEVYFANFYGGQIYKITVNRCATFSAGVQVTNHICAGEEAGSAELSIDGGAPPYLVEPVLSLDQLAAGTYELEVSDTNGCAIAISFTIEEYDLPQPEAIQDGDILIVAPLFASYQWLLDGVPVPGATANVFTPIEQGPYSVMVTDNNGCTNTSATVDFVVNVHTLPSFLRTVTVSPNPFSDQLRLQVQAESPVDLEIAVVALSGEVVMTKSIRLVDGLDQVLDLAALPAGVYYLRLFNNEEQFERKIVKQ